MDAPDLPSEVLFCIFSWLDPKDFDTYGLISRSWLQMSRENELWRHLCFKKWKKNPNNSQVSVNQLIPIIEGTSVIDWKQVFTLRTLADVALENFHTLATTSNSLHLIGHEYFDEGWINFDKFTALFNRIVSLLDTRPVTPDRGQHYLKIYSFIIEYELLMLRQLSSSMFSDFSYVGEFLKIHRNFRLASFDTVASMLAKNVISLRQVTQKKKIPIEVIGHQINLRGKYLFYSQHCHKTYRPFVDFLSTAILILDDWTKSDAFQSYIAEDYVNESEPVTALFWTLESLAGLMSIEELMNFIPGNNSVSQTTRIYLAAAVVAQNNSRIMLDITAKTFFETYYPWLFSDFKKDIQLLVPTFDTLGTVFSGLKREVTRFEVNDPNAEPTLKAVMLGSVKFLQSFVTQILTALDISHTRLQISVANSLMDLCEFFDESSFEPLLEPLLNKLYGLLNNKNSVLSIKVMSTICFILSMCPGSFHKHKGRVIAELNKLLSYTDAKEQEKVIEITCRLCTKIGSEMTDQLKPIYYRIIEAFKNNPSAYEDQILMLSVFAIRGLKNEFKEYLPIIVPVIYENRALELFHIGQFKTKEFDEYSFAKRRAALESTVSLIEHVDREYLLPYYEQIGDIISANIDVNGSKNLLPVACNGLAEYVKKFITFETTQTPQWTARIYQFIEDELVPYAALMHKLVNLREWFEVFLVYFDGQSKRSIELTFSQIVKYLCTVNPLIHPLHNDNHMRLSIDVIISSLKKLRESDEKHFSETVFNFFQLVLDHSLNGETFFNNFWKPILEPQILGLFHPSQKLFQLSKWIVKEVVERCGSRFTQFDLERYSLFDIEVPRRS